MHHLLSRQLRKLGFQKTEPPATPKDWENFLEKISQTYYQSDQDRYTFERTLAISSREMQELYDSLRKSSERVLARERDTFEATIASMREGLFNLDEKGNLLFMNPESEKLLGWKEAELLGKPVLNLVKPGKDWDLILRSEVYRNDDDLFYRKDGTKFPSSYVISPNIVEGKVVGYVLIFRDITERKLQEESLLKASEELEKRVAERTAELSKSNAALYQQILQRKKAEEEVRSSTSRLIALISNFPGGNLIEDERGYVIHTNDEFCRIFGLPLKSDEMLNKNLDEILSQHKNVLPVENPTQFLERFHQIAHNQSIVSDEEILLKDGRILSRSYFPIFVNQNYKGHLWQFQDVTESHQMKLHLQQSERMASIGTLAAGVAHEINNPLSFVSTNLSLIQEMLNDKNDPQTLKTLIQEAREGTARVRDIVRGLKTFSRGGPEKLETVDLRRAMDTAIKMAINEIRHRALLVKKYSEVAPIYGAVSEVVQIFLNLLINAAQAIPEGNVTENLITVSIGSDPQTKNAIVEVTDTGSGIDEAIMNRIFDPFFTTKPVGVGTGLGLSICHNIVNKMGGKITVRSQQQKGSTFRIALPTFDAGMISTVQSEKSHAETSPSEAKGLNIIIIDDEPTLASSLERILAKGNNVKSFTNAREGLKEIQSTTNIDVIVCDLMMPDLTGMDVYSYLKDNNPGLERQILFMSGGAFTQKARDFLTTVNPPFIEKPFDLKQLRLSITRLANATR